MTEPTRKNDDDIGKGHPCAVWASGFLLIAAILTVGFCGLFGGY